MTTEQDHGKPAEMSYVIAYSRESGSFNFNIMAFMAVMLLALTIAAGYAPLLLPAVAAAAVAYYYYPLKERTPRIGAGQYGIFVDGLGLISWRAVESIDIVPFTSRLAQTHELQIRLDKPLEQALLADWRRLPIWRLLMKLPWHMKTADVIRIPLEPFAPNRKEIHNEFVRLWRQFG